jgi:hypothetical protein
MSSKTIKVNPAFFSLSGSKTKTRKNTTRSNRKEKKKELKLLQPNKAKKRLLEKIKEHQRLKRKQAREESETKPGESKVSDGNKNDFSDELVDSISYLDDVIKKHKSSPKNKKKIKHETIKHEYNNEKTKQRLNKEMSEPTANNSYISNINSSVSTEVKRKPEPMSDYITLSHNQTIKKHTIKEDPPYGVLKGGSKPTYSQYYTLKSNSNTRSNVIQKPTLNIENFEDKKQNIERREKLNKIKSQIKQERESKKSINKNKRFKKFRIKKTTRTYKLGKHKDKRRVSVLIKNNVTKKKVNSDLVTLRKTPIIQIKKYLREKNLIKYSSNTPEYILRSMYMNAMLIGDIENVNKSNLIFNYLNNDENVN